MQCLTYHTSRSLSFLAIVAMILMISGCDKGNSVTPNQTQPAAVQGRVSGSNGNGSLAKTSHKTISSSVDGAVVTLAQIQSDGSLKTVSLSPIQTDASGQFLVQTDLNGAANLVVVAQKGGQTWQAVVSAAVQSGSTVESQPLDVQSTVQASVYEDVVAQGDTSQVTIADISYFVNSDVALQVWGNDTAIVHLANAIIVSEETQNSFLVNSSFGSGQAQLDILQNTEAAAERQLEVNLNAAGSNQLSAEIAYQKFDDSMATAYSQTTFSAGVYAEAAKISEQALLNASTSLGTSVMFDLEKQAALQEASSVNVEMEATFASLAAPQNTLTIVANAGGTLTTSITGATDTSQIQGAFDAYHGVVVNQLTTVLIGYASAISTLDASINGSGGARKTLSSSVSSSVNQQTLITSYTTFFSSVQNSVSANLTTATFPQVSSTAEILILTSMNV